MDFYVGIDIGSTCAKTVEEFTGNTITPETLAEPIHIINERRKAIARVYECRKAECLPISGRIAPAPRSIQGELSCGMPLLIEPEWIRSHRDKYC